MQRNRKRDNTMFTKKFILIRMKHNLLIYVKTSMIALKQLKCNWIKKRKTKLYKERINHDIWYIENWSFWLDIKIILATVFGGKFMENAY